MRKVLIVSRCHGKGLENSRAVIDQYAVRIGDRTWAGHFSEEGLVIIRGALLGVASKATAVSCFIVERGRFHLRWVVGHRPAFGADGDCPVAVSSSGHISLTSGAQYPWLRTLKAILKVAGVSHDIGKSNQWFIDKLAERARRADPIRHEVLSASILLGREITASPLLNRAPASATELLGWLVYTHHRLNPQEKSYVGPVPWHPDSASLRRLAIEAKNALPPPDFPAEASEMLFHYGRTALMLADHYVSSLASLPAGSSGFLANTSSTRPVRKEQDLGEHLKAVSRYSSHIASFLPRLGERLPGLGSEDAAELSKQSRGRFTWQNQAVRLAESVGKDDGIIVLLAAGTGAGKTRCAAKLLWSMPRHGRLRLTTALGLRTLTLQTGRAYRKELGFDWTQCQTLIGSQPVLALDAIRSATSEDDAGPEPFMEHGGPDFTLPKALLSEIDTSDARRFIGSPILVCTIDYLMGAADWRRARHLLATLRLLSSDVIIDEVDDYSPGDIVAISRLLWLAGLFGRRVLLSSATLTPEVAGALVAAFAHGREVRRKLQGGEPAKVLCCADASPPSLLPAHDTEAMSQFLHGIGTKARETALREPLRLGRIIPIPEPNTVGMEFDTELLNLHAKHHTNEGGVRCSVGLVRVARTRHAAHIAQALASEFSATERFCESQVVLYHSRLPLAVRSAIEEDLDDALQRKPGHSLASTRLVGPVIARAKEQGKADAQIIVVATPITEVGRDHDYDYAIIEPSSTRSVTQCAGRVNRHRRTVVTSPNLCILRSNLDPKFQRPGFEIEGHNFDRVRDLAASAAAFCERPSAADSLLPSPDIAPFASLERKVLANVVGTGTNNFIRDRDAHYRTEHMEDYEFRKSPPSQAYYYCIDRSAWFCRGSTPSLAKDTRIDFVPPSVVGYGWRYSHEEVRSRLEALIPQLAADTTPESRWQFSAKYLSVDLPEGAQPGDWVGDFTLGLWRGRNGHWTPKIFPA